MNGLLVGWTDSKVNGQLVGLINRWLDVKWLDGLMNGWLVLIGARQAERLMDPCMAE